jgi:hypothetical protein
LAVCRRTVVVHVRLDKVILEKYDRADAQTFDVYPLEQVYDVQEMTGEYHFVKAYLTGGQRGLWWKECRG